jgi:3-mercaptopyruvate sulfurtransferase SseA
MMQQGGIEDAAALVGGFEAWRAAGLPVETGFPAPETTP